MRFGASSECCCFLVSHANPSDLFVLAKRICNSVQRVASDSINSFDSSFRQDVYEHLRHVFLSHVFAPGNAELRSPLTSHDQRPLTQSACSNPFKARWPPKGDAIPISETAAYSLVLGRFPSISWSAAQFAVSDVEKAKPFSWTTVLVQRRTEADELLLSGSRFGCADAGLRAENGRQHSDIQGHRLISVRSVLDQAKLSQP
jgi:hypothetical protein